MPHSLDRFSFPYRGQRNAEVTGIVDHIKSVQQDLLPKLKVKHKELAGQHQFEVMIWMLDFDKRGSV